MDQLEANILEALSVAIPSIFGRLKSDIRPVMIGLTGLQGSGKSTWASGIKRILEEKYNLSVVQVSLDDFYHTHTSLVALRQKNPDNLLLKTRGQPGTHDEALAGDFFHAVRSGASHFKVPAFDKSRFDGEGDRVPESEWVEITAAPDVIVLEGWCLGFKPISRTDIVKRRKAAAQDMKQDHSTEPLHTLHNHSIEHLETVNNCLARYNDVFMGPRHLDILFQLCTKDLANVYRWRKQQELALIVAKGCGMTDREVSAFVQGYMPAYEMYLDGLQQNFFDGHGGDHHRLHLYILLGREREVLSINRK